MDNIFDCVIIGAGPSGMSAALYTSRANLKTLIIEKECPGGKMIKTKSIENYIGGFSTNSFELASKMFQDAIKFGAKYLQGNVVSIVNNSDFKIVVLADKSIIKTKTIILAIGGNISNSEFKYHHYLNKGLSYCVVCDANFYKDKVVAIIGDDKHIDDVIYLVNIAKTVIFLNKDKSYCNKENVITFVNVSEYKLLGERIEKLIINDNEYLIDGAFYVEDTNNFNGFISELETSEGYIKVDSEMHTNIEGIYACGDIVNKKVKQVVLACSNGMVAALETIKYVNKNR